MNISVRLLSTKHVKHVLARAIICSMLLILPSCGIPNLRLPEPAPDLPPTFNGVTTPDNSAQLGVEEYYNDPILSSLIDQALMGNRELRILDEEVQIARAEVLARTGAYLPLLSMGLGAGWDRPSRFTRSGAVDSTLNIIPGHPFPSPLADVIGSVNVFWQIDIWRQLRNARDAAQQRYLAAMERRTYFVTRLVAENAENYYRLMALDKRIETLDQIIELQEKSYKFAKDRFDNGRGTLLAVKRFEAEVRKNQSEKLIVKQEIVQVENRINFLLNRYPQQVERKVEGFFDLNIGPLSVGVPSQLLLNRADIRQAERELDAAGLDIRVARAKFFPALILTGTVGYEAYNPRYIFNPEALLANVAGSLVAPLINKRAIQAEYMTANARQLEAVYNYQRTVVNAFTEVINRVAMVENYSKSIDIKKQQLKALEASVVSATDLFTNARVEYVDVLLAQRDLMDARTVLIETKKEQLAAFVNAYQALGGGVTISSPRLGPPVVIVPPAP